MSNCRSDLVKLREKRKHFKNALEHKINFLNLKYIIIVVVLLKKNSVPYLSGPGNAHFISGRQVASDAGRIEPRLPPPTRKLNRAAAVSRQGGSL